MPLKWPLVGRENELQRIEAVLSDPDASGIVIGGSAGVGKSRLAHEALDVAASQGCEIRWMVGTSCGRGLPLGAVATWAGLAGSNSLQLVCGVIESLVSTTAPVVIGVDDPHLVDDLSMFILHQIVQRGAAKVVITVREEKPIPAALQDVWKIGQFERIDLAPLALLDIEALLAATLNGAIDPHASRGLWELTRGNALYLRHIVEQAVSDGHLTERDGLWRWQAGPALPRSLVELVESRLGNLPEGVGVVVDALAVGEPIELAILRRIADSPAVEQAEVRGLIIGEGRDDQIDFRLAHPLYGKVRRTHAAATRLRRLRGMLAAELAATDSSEDVPVLVRRAALSLESDLVPDPALLTRAAQGAIHLADLALADRLAAAAQRAGASAEAQLLRAHALSWLGRGDDAEALLGSIRTDGLSGEEQARLTYLRASNMLWALANPRRAKDIIDDGARNTTGPARRSIEAVDVVYRFALDEPQDALRAAEPLVLDELPPIVGAETAWALASIHGDAGRTAEAVAVAQAGDAIAIRCSDAPHMRLNLADAHAGGLLLAGRIADAVAVAESARAHATDLPATAHLLGPAIAGRVALAAGRLQDARELLQEACEALSVTAHAMGWGYRYGLPYATVLAMQGSLDEAVAVLSRLERLRRPFRSLDYERSLARAWLAAGQGALSEALEVLRSAAQRASAIGGFAGEVVCLQTAVQFGDWSCEARLLELEAVVQGPRVRLAAQLATAAKSDDPDELDSAADAFVEMGDLVAAVDAVAQACLAYRRREMRGSALRCAARANALADRCGGVETPMLRLVREPLPLTDREREVVMLVGQGMSNREVATRLTLSIRTVENHIYKAMTKTGTGSREELAALLCRPRRG